MNAKAALCKYLLGGKTLNIKNVFNIIGLTNAPREISRMVENNKTGFGVTVTRTPKKGRSRYGSPVTWYDYKLEKTNSNRDGIEKMKKYIIEQSKS